MDKPLFLISEAIDFKKLGNGRVGFTVLCVPAGEGCRRLDREARLQQYEVAVEADEYGIRAADPLHGWSGKTLALPKSQQSTTELTPEESADLVRWTMLGGSAFEAASDYLSMRVDSLEEKS